MMTGTIRNIQLEKRFGFLRGSDGKDRFFHETALDPRVNFDALKRGDEVEFDHEDGPKGPRAIGVRMAGSGV